MKSGLNKTRVKEISKLKGEPKWMLDFRLKAYDKFMELSNPIFGPELKINFDDITYYKRATSSIVDDWNEVPIDIKNTFSNIGLIDAEKKYLGGVGAQYESEVVYHNMLEEVEKNNIIFCDTDTALKKYPELFKEYFNNLQNRLDISEILWQNIVLEVPIRIRQDDTDITLEGEGWQLNKKSEEEIDPRLAKLQELLDQRKE